MYSHTHTMCRWLHSVYVYNLTYRVYVDHLTHSVCEHKGTRFMSAVFTLTKLTSTFTDNLTSVMGLQVSGVRVSVLTVAVPYSNALRPLLRCPTAPVAMPHKEHEQQIPQDLEQVAQSPQPPRTVQTTGGASILVKHYWPLTQELIVIFRPGSTGDLSPTTQSQGGHDGHVTTPIVIAEHRWLTIKKTSFDRRWLETTIYWLLKVKWLINILKTTAESTVNTMAVCLSVLQAIHAGRLLQQQINLSKLIEDCWLADESVDLLVQTVG